MEPLKPDARASWRMRVREISPFRPPSPLRSRRRRGNIVAQRRDDEVARHSSDDESGETPDSSGDYAYLSNRDIIRATRRSRDAQHFQKDAEERARELEMNTIREQIRQRQLLLQSPQQSQQQSQQQQQQQHQDLQLQRLREQQQQMRRRHQQQQQQQQQPLQQGASTSKLDRMSLRPRRACRDPWAFDRTISRDETATEAQQTARMLQVALGSRRERMGGRAADDVRLPRMEQRQRVDRLAESVNALEKLTLDERQEPAGRINEITFQGSPPEYSEYSDSSDDSQEKMRVAGDADRGNTTKPPRSGRPSQSRPARETLLQREQAAVSRDGDTRRVPGIVRAETMPFVTTQEWNRAFRDSKAAAREATMMANRFPMTINEMPQARQEPLMRSGLEATRMSTPYSPSSSNLAMRSQKRLDEWTGRQGT